jgi:hypothetical protein
MILSTMRPPWPVEDVGDIDILKRVMEISGKGEWIGFLCFPSPKLIYFTILYIGLAFIVDGRSFLRRISGTCFDVCITISKYARLSR